jgi:hypothetical protein
MNRTRLLARAQELRSEMRRLDLLLQASIVHRQLTCGNAGCKCARGQLHSAWSLTYKVKGKTQTIYLTEDIREEALQWVANWRRFRKLLSQHNTVLLQALRCRAAVTGKRAKGKG